MGEMSKADAERKRNSFRSKIEEAKKQVRENFDEMDFENARERTVMEGYIQEMEGEFAALIGTLDGMTFG